MLKTFVQHTRTTRPLASRAPIASPRRRVFSAVDKGTTNTRRPTGAMLTFNAASTICGVTPARILATRSSAWDDMPSILITGPTGSTTSASTGAVRLTCGKRNERGRMLLTRSTACTPGRGKPNLIDTNRSGSAYGSFRRTGSARANTMATSPTPTAITLIVARHPLRQAHVVQLPRQSHQHLVHKPQPYGVQHPGDEVVWRSRANTQEHVAIEAGDHGQGSPALGHPRLHAVLFVPVREHHADLSLVCDRTRSRGCGGLCVPNDTKGRHAGERADAAKSVLARSAPVRSHVSELDPPVFDEPASGQLPHPQH